MFEYIMGHRGIMGKTRVFGSIYNFLRIDVQNDNMFLQTPHRDRPPNCLAHELNSYFLSAHIIITALKRHLRKENKSL